MIVAEGGALDRICRWLIRHGHPARLRRHQSRASNATKARPADATAAPPQPPRQALLQAPSTPSKRCPKIKTHRRIARLNGLLLLIRRSTPATLPPSPASTDLAAAEAAKSKPKTNGSRSKCCAKSWKGLEARRRPVVIVSGTAPPPRPSHPIPVSLATGPTTLGGIPGGLRHRPTLGGALIPACAGMTSWMWNGGSLMRSSIPECQRAHPRGEGLTAPIGVQLPAVVSPPIRGRGQGGVPQPRRRQSHRSPRSHRNPPAHRHSREGQIRRRQTSSAPAAGFPPAAGMTEARQTPPCISLPSPTNSLAPICVRASIHRTPRRILFPVTANLRRTDEVRAVATDGPGRGLGFPRWRPPNGVHRVAGARHHPSRADVGNAHQDAHSPPNDAALSQRPPNRRTLPGGRQSPEARAEGAARPHIRCRFAPHPKV